MNCILRYATAKRGPWRGPEIRGRIDRTLLWTATGGNLMPNGATAYYTAPTTPGTYLVQVRAAADPRLQDAATATVTVVAGGGGIPPGGGGPGSSTTVSVSLYPKTLKLNAGQKFTFEATVVGSSNTAVDWRLASTKGEATLSQTGEFEALRPGTYELLAISQGD